MAGNPDLLLEVCVACGFVHRDDLNGTRVEKMHFHWAPAQGERTSRLDDGRMLRDHATVCASRSCLINVAPGAMLTLASAIDAMRLFIAGRAIVPARYRGMANATMPSVFTDRYGAALDETYYVGSGTRVAVAKRDWSGQ